MDTDPRPPEPQPATQPGSALERRHRSVRGAQVEVITRGEPRRRWRIDQKQMITAQSLVPGVSPTAVARQHGISTGQLDMWRRLLRTARLPGQIEIRLPDGTTRRVDEH